MDSMSGHQGAQHGMTEGDLARPVTRVRSRGLGADGRGLLERAIADSVIPRLVAMPWVKPQAEPPRQHAALGTEDVEHLLELCLGGDNLAVAAFTAGLRAAGATPEAIYTDLLTPAARRLGEMWEDDTCSFADVTLGVLRLQNAQRALAPDFVGAPAGQAGGPRILLLPVPGEQHTFGLTIVRDFFCRAGWDAWMGVVETDKDAVALVRRERADLVGLSFACDDRIDSAARLIASLRVAAANPDLVIMVGGPAFVADPSLARKIGADATAIDGHQAVLLAHELVHQREAVAL